MNNIYKLIILVVALTGASSVSASVIQSGLIDDFENGTTQSWVKGIEQSKAAILPPKNMANADESNRYLEVQSIGGTDDSAAREAHSRMVIFNESQWAGDYTGIATITASMKATSITEEYLYMRLAIFDEKVSGESQSRYVSSNAQLLKADGSDWQTLTFSLAPKDLTQFRGEKQAEEVLKNVSQLRFLSSKNEAKAWDVDKIAATLAIDNIAAVTTVPLPGAAWLMISGVLGLVRMSSSKRQIQ
jgi:hypothetical protein